MHGSITYLDDWHLVVVHSYLGLNLVAFAIVASCRSLRLSGRYIARRDAIFRSSISFSAVTIIREEAMHGK
jgi:hypothetical protein